MLLLVLPKFDNICFLNKIYKLIVSFFVKLYMKLYFYNAPKNLMANYMDILKNIYVKMLWKRFINRLEQEWEEKYSIHGPDIYHLNTPTKFAWAVHSSMETSFSTKEMKVKMINPYTLHHYFQQRGFPTGVKTSTLDLFSMYLGYERFSDFIKKNKKKAILRKENKLINTKKSKKINRKVLSIGIIVIFILLISWKDFPVNNSNEYLKAKEEITTVINKAAQLEFNLYKSLPDAKDSIKLSSYFTTDGSATSNIKGYVDNVMNKKRKLRIPGSFFYIENMEITNISDAEAIVKTTEKWRLLWYKITTNNNEVLYEATNNQKYILKKVDGNWKIHHNDYQGEAKKVDY